MFVQTNGYVWVELGQVDGVEVNAGIRCQIVDAIEYFVFPQERDRHVEGHVSTAQWCQAEWLYLAVLIEAYQSIQRQCFAVCQFFDVQRELGCFAFVVAIFVEGWGHTDINPFDIEF